MEEEGLSGKLVALLIVDGEEIARCEIAPIEGFGRQVELSIAHPSISADVAGVFGEVASAFRFQAWHSSLAWNKEEPTEDDRPF